MPQKMTPDWEVPDNLPDPNVNVNSLSKVLNREISPDFIDKPYSTNFLPNKSNERGRISYPLIVINNIHSEIVANSLKTFLAKDARRVELLTQGDVNTMHPLALQVLFKLSDTSLGILGSAYVTTELLEYLKLMLLEFDYYESKGKKGDLSISQFFNYNTWNPIIAPNEEDLVDFAVESTIQDGKVVTEDDILNDLNEFKALTATELESIRTSKVDYDKKENIQQSFPKDNTTYDLQSEYAESQDTVTHENPPDQHTNYSDFNSQIEEGNPDLQDKVDSNKDDLDSELDYFEDEDFEFDEGENSKW